MSTPIIAQPAWKELLQQLEQELDASEDDTTQAQHRCQLAQIHWDIFGNQAAAALCLSEADPDHPMVRELTRQLALAAGDAASAAAQLRASAELPDAGAARGSLLLEAAQLELFWRLDAHQAFDDCLRALAVDDPPVGAAELCDLALSVSDRFEALAGRALDKTDATLSTVVAGALVLWDHLGRTQPALQLLRRALKLDPDDFFIVELLLELAAQQPDTIDRVGLLERKLSLIEGASPGCIDARAVSFELSRLLALRGDFERSRELFASIDSPLPHVQDITDSTLDDEAETNPPPAATRDWSAILTLAAQRDVAVQASNPSEVYASYQRLATVSGVPGLVRVYRLRAIQWCEAAGGDLAPLRPLLEANTEENPADVYSSAMFQRLCLRGRGPAPLVEHYARTAKIFPDRSATLYRSAAIIAEAHVGDHARAAELRRAGITAAPDPFGLGDLERLHRRSNAELRLLETYRRHAETAGDQALAAALWGAVASLELKQRQYQEAEASAHRALAKDPENLLALGVLATAQTDTERVDELKQTLERQLAALRAPANRRACRRRLASLASVPNEAIRQLEAARQEGGDDIGTLSALASLYEQTARYDDASKLREAIGNAATDPAEAVLAYAEAGRLQEKLGNAEGALRAYQEALAVDPQAPDVLALMADLLVRAGDVDAARQVLERQLELSETLEHRATLLIKLADVLERTGADPEQVITTYREATHAWPQSRQAIDKLQGVCRAHDRWDLLAGALAELPQDDYVLDLLAEALQHLGQLSELSEVRTRLLRRARDERDIADRAYDLGRVHEQRGQIEAAVAAYSQGIATVQHHRPSLRALQRIHQAAGNMQSLERVLALELEADIDDDRRAEILVELAHHAPPRLAIDRLERAHDLQPDNREALEMLETLYATERPLDMARLLRRRAAVETDAKLKSSLELRAAESFAAHRQDSSAATAFEAALAADPGNRQAFTSYEAFCYEREMWHDIMDVYDQTIASVQGGDSRAYRLVDLYARRGQLQAEQLAQPGEASANYLLALEQDPKSDEVMKMLQHLLVVEQDWEGLANAHLARARMLPEEDPLKIESLRLAARVATSRLGESRRGLELWDEVLRNDPTDQEATENLETLYERHREWARLADLLDTKLLLSPDQQETIPARLQLADLVEQELEDPERAATIYASIREIDEHHEVALQQLGRIYEATASWNECIEVLQHQVLIEADPDERSLLYFKCGSIMEARFHDDAAAIRYYERSIEESPGCLPAVHSLRELYLKGGQPLNALRTLEHELRLWEGEHEQAGVLARMGEIRLQYLHDDRKALEEFEDALAFDPDCEPALVAIFGLYCQRGQREQAQAIAERLAPRLLKDGDPHERSAFFTQRARLAIDTNDRTLAAESLVVALELDPQNIAALDLLIDLIRQAPDAIDYALVFRELEQTYRHDGNQTALGYVLMAAGALAEVAGDAEIALEVYGEAEQTVPQAFPLAKARADLLVGLRRTNEALAVLDAFIERAQTDVVRLEALLAKGELLSELELDARGAADCYRSALQLDPSNAEAALRLAQELYLKGRFEDAQQLMATQLERASQNGCPPTDLARLHHYHGVTMLRAADTANADAAFRQALRLDPSCREAALALGRRLLAAGDREAAAELLTHTIHELARQSPATTTLELRRTLAALHLGGDQPELALRELQAIVDEGIAETEDHLALAAVLARDAKGVSAAIEQLERVLSGNRLDPTIFGTLADLYQRAEEPDRSAQVLQVSALLGILSEEEKVRLERLRRQHPFKPARTLDDHARSLALVPIVDSHIERMWSLLSASLERIFPFEPPDKKPRPYDQIESNEFRLTVRRVLRLLESKATVQVGGVPGGAITDSAGGRIILDARLVHSPPSTVAFALGRADEITRSGHGLLGRLAFDDRQLLLELLAGLLQPGDQRSDLAEEFTRRLPRKLNKQIDEVASSYQGHLRSGNEPELPLRWAAAVERTANNFGLLACDDISAAFQMLALLGHEEPAIGVDGEIPLDAMEYGPELATFFLSADYIRLRRQLVRA